MLTARFHLIIDLEKLDSSILTNQQGLHAFIETIAQVTNMKVLYGPIVKEGIPENPGLSGFAIIDYSHISVHTFTKNHEALIDIFSCKTYEQTKVREKVLEYFQAKPEQAHSQIVQWG